MGVSLGIDIVLRVSLVRNEWCFAFFFFFFLANMYIGSVYKTVSKVWNEQ